MSLSRMDRGRRRQVGWAVLVGALCLTTACGEKEEAVEPGNPQAVGAGSGATEAAEVRICPTCQRRYFAGERYCMYDQTALVPVDDARAAGKVCPVCGRHYPANKNFCTADGATLEALPDKASPATADASATAAPAATEAPAATAAPATPAATPASEVVAVSRPGEGKNREEKQSPVSSQAALSTHTETHDTRVASLGTDSSSSSSRHHTVEKSAEPVSHPVSTPEPVVRSTPRPVEPVRPAPEPVVRNTPAPRPPPEPVVRNTPAPAPVAVASKTKPETNTKAVAAPGGNPLKDFEQTSALAAQGKLSPADISALDAVPSGGEDFTRAQTLLAMNFKNRDNARYYKALNQILSAPENQYNPVYNLELAEYYLLSKKYKESVEQTRKVDRYKQRFPHEVYYQRVARMYEVEAKALEGEFNSSEDVSYLEKAISTWRRYITHVKANDDAEKTKMAEDYVAKLEKIKGRMQ